jgi:hypothetical protein
LEALHPGHAVPLTSAGRLVHAAGGSVATRPAGVDRRLYAANPLVDDLRANGGSVYDEAARHAGAAPTLFPEGALPVATASGIPPRVLTSLPWYGRHPVAAAATVAEAEDLIADLSEPGHLVEDYRPHAGNRDYDQRVRDWSFAGVNAAADARPVGGSSRRVAAARDVAEMTDDEIEAEVFGPDLRRRRYREYVQRIVDGTAVGTGIAAQQARAELDRMDREDREAGR